MSNVTKDLLEALRDLIDSHWLHDSHAVDFDGTVLFSPSYEFSNLHCHRRSELRMDGFECVVWPGWYPDFKWSAYSTYEGSLWFEQFDSEAEARAVCMKLLADVMPEHSVSKAMAAIARAEAALDHSAELQPAADGAWKSAVIDQLVIAHILTAEHESDPLKAVQDLLAYHADAHKIQPWAGGKWQTIETAPKDKFLLLCGPSGYTTTPWRKVTGIMHSNYHAGRWIDHANDDLVDWGFEPTHWMPLPAPPES